MIMLESVADGAAISPFFAWLMSQLHALAAIRTPLLDKVFSVLTYLGHEMGFLFIAMILLWCVNKKYGYRLLIIFLVGTFLQQILKAIFMIPRPWVLDPNFQPVESAIAAATGFSFPSGHTTTACLALGAIAIYMKKKWAYIVAAIVTLLVAFSRMYLGVHTLLDVGVGLLIGVIMLAVFTALFRKNEDKTVFVNVFMCIGLLLSAVLVVYLVLNPVPQDAVESARNTYADSLKDASKLLGAAIGMLAGKLLDDRFVQFKTEAVWWKQVLKVLLGLVIIVAIWYGLKKVFPENQPILDGVRYFAMAIVGVGIYPMLFKKLIKPVRN
ncbi:MAG: phosphatase PAP2 family protein [Clostridia bacterium]|nr:phosphatase PAP2 family protein [Clostridia bacterium]